MASESRVIPLARSTDNNSIRSLTGLRFVAAIAVFFSHLPHLSFISFGFYGAAYLGYHGLALFFVLSAFILTVNYYDRFAANFKENMWPYAVARIARIYPLHVITFLTVFGFLVIIGKPNLNLEAIFRQLTLTQAWSKDWSVVTSFNSPAWSLSVELFLYMCFPGIAYILLKKLNNIRQLLFLAVTAHLTLLLYITWLCWKFNIFENLTYHAEVSQLIYTLPVTRLCGFIIGCVAGRIFLLKANTPVSPREQRWGRVGLVAGLAGAMLIMLVAPGPDWQFLEFYRLGNTSAPFFALIVYCLARYKSWPAGFLGSRLIYQLGEASFTFYLLHFYFLMVTGQHSNLLGGYGLYLYMGFMFLMLLGLSWLIHRAVERPLYYGVRSFLLRQKLPALPFMVRRHTRSQPDSGLAAPKLP